MYKIAILSTCLALYACNNFGQSPETKKEKTMNKVPTVVKTEEEWKKQLTDEQYYVIRQKGTERPFTGKYYKTDDKGVYSCAACGNELFTSDMKFDSECGWPSFDREILGDKIITQVDTSHGMIRTEIMCAKCGGHLGHLFDDGPTDTGKRYCVNSASLNFVAEKKKVN
ncbi:MAG TPA: peptide-methionine (R)-S-oxide reductase MsrB [Cyclobacteriaceae bacterium]|nr:peptide-methionine (R)-S-oxide reductase MsrB [Cyclobacteriaceae bacterium]